MGPACRADRPASVLDLNVPGKLRDVSPRAGAEWKIVSNSFVVLAHRLPANEDIDFLLLPAAVVDIHVLLGERIAMCAGKQLELSSRFEPHTDCGPRIVKMWQAHTLARYPAGQSLEAGRGGWHSAAECWPGRRHPSNCQWTKERRESQGLCP